MLLLALAGAPHAQLTDWARTREGQARDLRFTDKDGAHLVRFALGAKRQKKTEEGYTRDRDLHVTHTVGTREVWKAKDFVKQCEFDLELEFLDNSIEVTDLDDDGIAVVSFLYKLGCRSDVSPLEVKLLMYEGKTKYALRGESYERVGETEYMGGTFKPDFGDAPPAFLEFAKAKWQRLVVDLARPKD